jgi:patatin-like phospholipase/acyl hydrolase
LENAFLSDVCIGTSADPTYLPAHSFETKDSRGNSKSFNLIDGGVAANNPTLLAVNHALREAIFRNPNQVLSKPSIDDWPLALGLEENESSKFLVLSLGTGHNVRHKATDAAKWGWLGWVRPIIDILMQSNANMVEIQASLLFKGVNKHEYLRIQEPEFKASNKHEYLRIQEPDLKEKSSSMDLATEENLNGLKMIGTQLLDKPFSRVKIDTGHYEEVGGKDAMTNRDVLTRFAKELSAERMLRLTGVLIK